MPPVITLTTDFGLRDGYVAAMKGVILSIMPAAQIVDISHDVAPQDVMEAAFVLRSATPFFPPESIHVAIVDPGVGSARRPVALSVGAHRFVGPDNGLFSLVSEGAQIDETVELDKTRFWRVPDPGATFHGRDIFAPVAAHILSGRSLAEVGSPFTSLQPMHWAMPIEDHEGVQGWVVHVDRFGNCITNISEPAVERHRADRTVKCYVGGAIVTGLSRTYSDVPAGEPLALFGSTGALEVAVNGGNAAHLYGIQKGASVSLIFADRRP